MNSAALAGPLALFLLAAPALAGAREPSTLAERRKAVETTRQLERFPLAPGANGSRMWLLKWIVEIPDINVRGCSGPLDALAQDGGGRHGKALYAQAMFGMTVFMIENPLRKDDWLAVQLAGVESTLRAYQALLEAEPTARWEELDSLLEIRRQGRLQELLEKVMEGCGDERGPGPEEAI